MEAQYARPVCLKWKQKLLILCSRAFVQGEWSPKKDCNLVEDLNFVTFGIHPTPYPPVFYLSLEVFPCPRHLIAPFGWRWSWKVSETCLRHILSLYLIYDLTASKYQSYLNCHRHKHDNLQKTFVTTKSQSSNNRYLFHPVWAICKRLQSKINDKYLSSCHLQDASSAMMPHKESPPK